MKPSALEGHNRAAKRRQAGQPRTGSAARPGRCTGPDAATVMQAAQSKSLPYTDCRHTTAGFTRPALGGYGLRCLTPTRSALTPIYPVSVRRLVLLLRAAFRPHLAVKGPCASLRFTSTRLGEEFPRAQLTRMSGTRDDDNFLHAAAHPSPRCFYSPPANRDSTKRIIPSRTNTRRGKVLFSRSPAHCRPGTPPSQREFSSRNWR